MEKAPGPVRTLADIIAPDPGLFAGDHRGAGRFAKRDRQARPDGRATRAQGVGAARRRALDLSWLLRRRELWWPTLWGWAVLSIAACATLVMLGLSARSLLALDAPAHGPDGLGARTLIVEGWLDEDELVQAVAAFRRGRYERVLTTGGPIDARIDVGQWRHFALRAAAYLRTHGVGDVPVIAVPAPATKNDRSYLSALMVRAWARQQRLTLTAVDVYSAGMHARRSRTIFRLALGNGVEVGAMAARPSEYDDTRWWASSSGAKATLDEVVSLAWTQCCFWPGPPEDAQRK